MNNEVIKLDEEKAEQSAIELMAKGYGNIDVSGTQSGLDSLESELSNRIESGNLEGVPAVSLISKGMAQIAENTANRRAERRGNRMQQQSRIADQEKTFNPEY
jgi:hypothetical protein